MLTENALCLSGGRNQVVYRAGTGPALVYLHGLYGVSGDAPFIEALARCYAVTAPLAPGFAELAELDDLHDIHDLALRYDDLLDALELEQAVLVGHSFGAMIAAEIAAHTPGRISRLVLLSPLGLWSDAYPVADLWGVPPAELASLLYTDPAAAPAVGPITDVEAAVARVRGMTAVARFLWPIPDRGLSRRLRRVRAQTLVIHGEQDRFVPVQYAHDFVALMPSASAHILPGAGHMLPTEALESSLTAVDSFLSAKPVRTEVHV
ncbi:MAG TPA: alpha/beta fold hydrolase [Chloroflexota bacterium]|nr:alpha/beta fold hydrolase [Chloroflexota bacterium]